MTDSGSPLVRFFCGSPDHAVHCRIKISDDSGWDAFIEVNGHVVFTAHYSDWHRIERLCARLEALANSGAMVTSSHFEGNSRR